MGSRLERVVSKKERTYIDLGWRGSRGPTTMVSHVAGPQKRRVEGSCGVFENVSFLS